jgi:UDP-N-acetylglucosamine/UDP-N-acetylgalactosamine diphosphorylase
MDGRGVEALDVLCVDNILARVADPEFVGCCASRGSQLGARMLAKAYPEEKVGVFAQDDKGRLQVGRGLWGWGGSWGGGMWGVWGESSG